MSDILQPILKEDIPKLCELYRENLPRNTHVYNYLHTVMRWIKVRPDNNHITLHAPHGNWKDGTFIGIHKHEDLCNELFVSTIAEDPTILIEVLVNTKRIQWNKELLLFSVHEDLQPAVRKALDKTSFHFHMEKPCYVYWLPAEKASRLEISCPPEIYIDKLNTSHAKIINSHWPHRYENSDKYIAKIIELNGGQGVFLKSDGTLVAWMLRNLMGLAALQTVDEYKRKGYGSLITQVVAKDIGKEGLNPMGTVLHENIGSQKMFQKLGFEVLETVIFTESQELSNIRHNNISY